MKKRSFICALSALAIFFQPIAQAEDIDLFLGIPPTDAAAPNVLFVIDNTANWNTPISGTTRFAQEKAALESILSDTGLIGKVNLGVMLFAESPVKGSYVRAAIRPMTSTTLPLYHALVQSLDNNNDKGANALYGYSMAEAYRYFQGQEEYLGGNEPKRDYHNNTTGTAQSKAIYQLSNDADDNIGKNAFTSASGSPYTYNKPPTVAGCAKNFIIYLSNGPIDNNDKDNTSPSCNSNLESCTAKQLLEKAAGTANAAAATTPIAISPNDEQNSMADEWAKFMFESSLKVTTYTIDIGPNANVQGRAHSALLQSMSDVSKGERFLVNNVTTEEIKKAIEGALSQILAVNSVFASASLPASSNTQSTYLNQVFIGMFRPDGNAKPRWTGNIKQYKFGLVNNQLRLVYDDTDDDVNNTNDQPAINSSTGFITACARSYWTTASPAADYWNYLGSFFKSTDQTGCSTSTFYSNSPDGQFVEKGAQAQQLRASTSRNITTCSPVFASCTTTVPFTTSLSTTDFAPSLFGLSSTTGRDELINWARGVDVDDENKNSNFSEMRPSSHGDVVHSRPVVINYGDETNKKVVVYYSANDGMLRAINGNRKTTESFATAAGTTLPGTEFWAFMPPEFLGTIKRLREDTTLIDYPGSTASDVAPKPYGLDGPLVSYTGTIGSATKTFLYAGMRRGGRALYAFDVSDVTKTTGATYPSLKWKIGCPGTDSTGCSGAPDHTGDVFTGIGQTWSPPSIIQASGYPVSPATTPATYKPILIMGGGYDTCEDTDTNTSGTYANNSCSSPTGNKIYVMDADTGELLNTFTTARSVIAGFTVVPDNSGLAQYAYTADLGGNIYRVNIGSDSPDDWTMTTVAKLGCDTGSSCNPNRKFMFAPDVLKDSSGAHYLLIGSGDREKPLTYYQATTQVTNYFYMVKDFPANTTTWLQSENTTCSADVICQSSLTLIGRTAASPAVTDISEKGWYLQLADNEQVVTSAITVSNTVTFSTHQPAVTVDGSCSSNLGTALVYNINYKNAESTARNQDGSIGARYADIAGDGLPPSPVAGQVKLDDGTTVPFIIGASPDSPLEGSPPSSTLSWTQPKSRVYWYIEQ